MSFTIKHGLFRANITDHHAILGVSLDANPKAIRLKYLRIAQKLHPDTCQANLEEKKLANQILSRLVNPAYEELSNKTQFAEYQLVLTQVGKRYAQKSERMTIASEPAKKLLQAEANLDRLYNDLLKELTANQYQKLDKVLTKIAVISELNLIYLTLKHKQGIDRENIVRKPKAARSPSPPTVPAKPSQPQAPPETQIVEPTPQSRVASYLRRAKEYLAKNNINDAVFELKDALRIDPNNSTCHAYMGQAYLQQNQITMAKVHINKAYRANPLDPIAIHSKEQLEKLTEKQQRSSKAQTKSSNKGKKDDSGFFSGFFGAKKK